MKCRIFIFFLFKKMIESFLNNEPSVEEFLDAFVPKKSLSHQRRIKSDKTKELVNRAKNRTDSQSSLYQPPPITTTWGSPYPAHLPNIPMPVYPVP